MARKSNTAQRRGEIVSAMLAAMAEHGYEKATVQMIAQHAGLAPGLVHYHFKTKAEILHELIRTLAALSRERYITMSQAAITCDDRLHAYVNARLAKGEGADPRAVAAWVVIGTEAVRQPEVRAIYQEVVRAEAQLIEELLKDCLVDRGKDATLARPLAAALLALIDGAFQLSSAAPDVMPAGYAASTAIDLLDRYLSAPQ